MTKTFREQAEQIKIHYTNYGDGTADTEETMSIPSDVLDALTALHQQELEQVDRFEVIDETGRAYVRGSIYGSPVKIELSYQDDGKTLKVFVEQRQRAGLGGKITNQENTWKPDDPTNLEEGGNNE